MSARVTVAPGYIALPVLRDGTTGDVRFIFGPPTGRRNCERLFKLRRASKPRLGDVFLVLGDLEGSGDVRFEDLAEVTWCDHAPYAHDLAYRPVRWR